MDIAMDPRLVAAMARHRLRGSIVATVVKAGDAGLAEDDLRAGFERLAAVGARTPELRRALQGDFEWAVRSLGRDGLIVLEAGRLKLGPNARAWLDRWSEQRTAAVAPQEAEA